MQILDEPADQQRARAVALRDGRASEAGLVESISADDFTYGRMDDVCDVRAHRSATPDCAGTPRW